MIWMCLKMDDSPGGLWQFESVQTRGTEHFLGWGMCFLFNHVFFLLRQAMLTHIHILYTILRPFLSGHFFEMGLTYQRVDVVQYSTLYYPKDLFQQSMWLRPISLYEQVQGLHSRSQSHTAANKRVWMYFSQDMMCGLVKNCTKWGRLWTTTTLAMGKLEVMQKNLRLQIPCLWEW